MLQTGPPTQLNIIIKIKDLDCESRAAIPALHLTPKGFHSPPCTSIEVIYLLRIESLAVCQLLALAGCLIEMTFCGYFACSSCLHSQRHVSHALQECTCANVSQSGQRVCFSFSIRALCARNIVEKQTQKDMSFLSAKKFFKARFLWMWDVRIT